MTAGEIVRQLRDEKIPLLEAAGPCPKGISEYAFLMEQLGSSKERAEQIKKFIGLADKDSDNRIQINWCHLLLAALVNEGYVHRILTTNFDPLIVDALALTGQPIRTFDLSTSGKYESDILDPATVIYLHGQMHSLLLANTQGEMAKVQSLYPAVLQEAIADSFLIVVGYSGDCDPVLDALTNLSNLQRGLWWSHFSSSGQRPGAGVESLFRKHGSNCHLAQGDDADTFMRKLVFEGLGVKLPREVLDPFQAADCNLGRIAPFPFKGLSRPDFTGDPAISARKLVKKAGESAASQKLQLVVDLEMASLGNDWENFDLLRKNVTKNPALPLSCAVGDGLLKRAALCLDAKDLSNAISFLKECELYGVIDQNRVWLHILWGNALSDQAVVKGNCPEADNFFAEAEQKYAEAVRLESRMHSAFFNWGIALSDQAMAKGNSPEADKLFSEAGQKYAEAVRIKPDKHEAFYNWGIALSAQAKGKGNSPEVDKLYAEAGQKYAKAVRLKPDMHQAFYNWGTALLNQAKVKGSSPEADKLYAEAGQKYAEAVRLKPDYQVAYFNLACLAGLLGDTSQAVLNLQHWKKHLTNPTRAKLDNDTDFDRIRDTAEFKAFRETLPT